MFFEELCKKTKYFLFIPCKSLILDDPSYLRIIIDNCYLISIDEFCDVIIECIKRFRNSDDFSIWISETKFFLGSTRDDDSFYFFLFLHLKIILRYIEASTVIFTSWRAVAVIYTTFWNTFDEIFMYVLDSFDSFLDREYWCILSFLIYCCELREELICHLGYIEYFLSEFFRTGYMVVVPFPIEVRFFYESI